jgi:hypothetical protein
MVRCKCFITKRLTDIAVPAVFQFAFQLGGAISQCISQTLFLQRMTAHIKSELPEIATPAVINAGASGLLTLTQSPTELQTLKAAYTNTTRSVCILLLVASGRAFLASLSLEHKIVKKIEQEQKTAQNS